MSVTNLITNYEAHLEANWTREGERKICLGTYFSPTVPDTEITFKILGWTCKFCSQPVSKTDFAHHYLDRVHPECLKNNAN